VCILNLSLWLHTPTPLQDIPLGTGRKLMLLSLRWRN